MRILLAHSDPLLPARESIDLWRIIRPFRELAKHVDWQIDHTNHLIPLDLYGPDNKVPTDKLVGQIARLAEYDIIWSSYFPDAVLFDFITFVCDKYGIKFVLDVDDDMYNIPPENGFWKSAGAKGIKELQWMIEQSPHVVTTCTNLKKSFAAKRKGPIHIWPNYVGDDFKHKSFYNKDRVVIGYSGSITHKKDLFNTGFIDALQQIMHKYKHVHMGTVGLSIDAYLPKQRYTHHPGKPGQDYIDEVWPNINCDIAVAPLEKTKFNVGRSNIKWLEAAMIPAAFIGSNIAPYKGTVIDGQTGLLTDNSSEGWYEALESLIVDKPLRNKLARGAHNEVRTNWHMSHKWQNLKKLVEEINS